MRILVSGSSGLVGQALVGQLRGEGHPVLSLVRREPLTADEVLWDPDGERFDPERAAGTDGVVHLAGENIASGRWTETRKKKILESRRRGTAFLTRSLLGLERRPRVVVAASAVGYYGDAGESLVDESSPSGEGFLAEVCREWEGATAPLADAGIRVVNLRIGIVLSTAGGALAQMLPLFRFGLGGRIGSGRQWMSWIALPDLTGVIVRVLEDDGFHGPVNAAAPEPVRSEELTRTLGRLLGRPTVLPAPAFALRLVLGEMADEMLLASTRVDCRVLRERGHAFATPKLDPALRSLLEEKNQL